MVKILDLMPARVAPVVLAAGESVRMGHPKALLPLRGGTFLSAILDTLEALDLDAPFVVLGGHTAEIAPSLSRRQVRIVLNPDFKQGQLSSIQRALGALGPEASCALLWPVDQPGVSQALVQDLVARYRETGAPLVLPLCGGRRGHPAIVARALFEELLATPAERGAKEVILRHEAEMALVETAETAAILDIDTPEDYLRFTGESLASALERARSQGR